MEKHKITKAEADLLLTAIKRIVDSEILEKQMSTQIPLTSDLPDSNTVYTGKVAVLFVDIRKSTSLPEKFNSEQLVKIYRSYIRTIVQAIRYSGGYVRDFMGDGVLAIFIDEDEDYTAEEKAVIAARYITTAIDKFLNPQLDKSFKYRVSCGIGIHTGEVSVSKVGMRGREQDETSENEYGIAWIGDSTNFACKYSGAVECGDIFISESTYTGISDINERENWNKAEILHHGNYLKGYIARRYYLSLDEEKETYAALPTEDDLAFSKVLENKLEEIAIQAKNLGEKFEEVQQKENEINIKEKSLSSKEKSLDRKEQMLFKQEYEFYCEVLSSGHCKKAYVKVMGKDFWEENLEKAIKAGIKIGLTERKVKQEISYAMVSIYEDLELYDKAYDFLVEQAAGYAWLHLSTVKNIVNRVGYCDRLKDAVYLRLAQNNLDSEHKNDFEDVKTWLVFEFKK